MIPVRLSKDAANYVRKETEYLRLRNPTAAMEFSRAMKNAKSILQNFPEAGNRMHGLQIARSLTLVTGNHLIDYIYDASCIGVLAIRHGRMANQTPNVDIDGDMV